MDYEDYENWEQGNMEKAIYRQHQEAAHDEDLAKAFFFDEFNELNSFDNTHPAPNNSAPVSAGAPFASPSRGPAELRLPVVLGNSAAAPHDHMGTIETATQRLEELDLGGKAGEPTVTCGRSESRYVCAFKECKGQSPPELQLSTGMKFYCTQHYGQVPHVWRMQCIAPTMRGARCRLRDYRVLHPGVAPHEYRCKKHWPTVRGRIFRSRSSYNPTQHLVSLSSSVGMASRLLRGGRLRPSIIHKDVYGAHDLYIILNGRHQAVFSKHQFNDLTQGLDTVLKENIWHVVVDYFTLLEAGFHQDQHLEYSGSIISWRYQNDDRSSLITECLKRGNVYFLLYDATNLTRKRPHDGIAIKIGNTQQLEQRADSHRALCKVPIECGYEFPEEGDIPFAYLLEVIVHEMLRAHQHDLACQCNTTHTELYWFRQEPGFEKYQNKVFYAITRTLAPIIHHWIAAIRDLHQLHAELQHAHSGLLKH
ncbi:unnamed protein product [Mortierella alpina]